MSTTPTKHPSIAALQEALRGIPELQGRIFGALGAMQSPDGQAFRFDQPVLTMAYSLADVDAQLTALTGLVRGLQDIGASVLIPPTHASNAAARLNELRDAHMATLADALEGALASGIQSLDPDNWRLVSNNGATLQPYANLQQMQSKMGEFADQVAPLIAITRVGMEFSAVVAFAREQTLELHTSASSARRSAELSEKDAARAKELADDAAASRQEADRLKSDIDAHRKTTTEYAAEAVTKIAEIRQEAEKAGTLRAAVEAYQTQFDAFKAALEEREASFKSRDKEQTDLGERLKGHETEIKRLVDAAEAMLTGANVAGLASAYGKTRKELADELRGARRAFQWGIFFLAVSVLPLATFVLPHLFGLTAPAAQQPPQDAALYALQIAARLILLVPAAWFLRFAANRHAALFRLREEYAHRYALASSVEGFKKQAEKFKEEIAGATYFHLTANPAATLSDHAKGGDDKAPHPLLEKLMDVFTKKVDGKN